VIEEDEDDHAQTLLQVGQGQGNKRARVARAFDDE